MELVIDHAELIRNIELKTRSYAHERKTDSQGFLLRLYISTVP